MMGYFRIPYYLILCCTKVDYLLIFVFFLIGNHVSNLCWFFLIPWSLQTRPVLRCHVGRLAGQNNRNRNRNTGRYETCEIQWEGRWVSQLDYQRFRRVPHRVFLQSMLAQIHRRTARLQIASNCFSAAPLYLAQLTGNCSIDPFPGVTQQQFKGISHET